MGYETEEEAIAAAKSDVDLFTDFDGWNCNEDEDRSVCVGWDGSSYRCDCGNRRVCWEVMQSKDGTFTAHAQAY